MDGATGATLDDDLEIEIRLRAPRQVAARLLVLAAVCRRAFLEREPGALGRGEDDADEDDEADPNPEDAETERFDLTAWLRQARLDRAATPAERDLLHTRVGHLSPEDVTAATWQGEALAVLAWAAALLPERPNDPLPADPAAALAALPAPWDDVHPFVSGLTLRPEEEIAAAREQAELWFWRIGVEGIYRQAAPEERAELRVVIREVARDALHAGLLPALAGDDFPVRGRPLAKLSAPDLDRATAAAEMRLRALNWLCGFGRSWDDAPIEV